ncbi:SDR family oxidoreductase [Rhodococcus sp. IEGM 1401]|uniref:SDR family oxidoreductase n=1 Tax=unclassified Rhodococcus (in: high G+C Gram-positive bacteria) TaxID=192944 RepID=UPI0022B3053D|nr:MULTISPECIES: SDR family oxidoreductase [unclassified Rhodococcus (in: high G+C Gram-positive bacteria)]MCZ4559912.1 SDR family oxidoreductase [Rhodococcus sp. IEGM 1401]MDI9920044.1 SDR family oxidoreductase [Rhodococcus sp. IEGM 1372]MDV8032493.1 SDR family oxidoreductase [Rhodococcus sp. IEGM 1414]
MVYSDICHLPQLDLERTLEHSVLFMTSRFQGKRILITGATNGIGLAGARLLAREGAQLILTGTNNERLAALADEISSATVLFNDASLPDTGHTLAEQLDELVIDGLWFNAGYAGIAPITDVSTPFFDTMMATNVRGPLLQLAALSDQLSDGASVVVTSSTSTYEGAPLTAVYAATKAALIAAARTWATELAPRKIRVNTLVPGAIETGFRSFMDTETRQDFEAGVLGRVPLGRIGTAPEAAAVALFLLSEESSYVTASQYSVDGGLGHR